jgi:hypothetical protein
VVPREVIFGMDQIERRVSLIAVGVALVSALVYGVSWIRKWPSNGPKFVKGKACPSAYPDHVKSFCAVANAQGQWALRFLFVVVIALVILVFAWKRKRAGVACFACFLGLGDQPYGIVFLFMGVWLIVRAFRLQRYGEASWKGSNKMAREMAQARRDGRVVTPKAASASAPAPTPGPVAPPSASKRYTPKQKPRKR